MQNLLRNGREISLGQDRIPRSWAKAMGGEAPRPQDMGTRSSWRSHLTIWQSESLFVHLWNGPDGTFLPLDFCRTTWDVGETSLENTKGSLRIWRTCAGTELRNLRNWAGLRGHSQSRALAPAASSATGKELAKVEWVEAPEDRGLEGLLPLPRPKYWSELRVSLELETGPWLSWGRYCVVPPETAPRAMNYKVVRCSAAFKNPLPSLLGRKRGALSVDCKMFLVIILSSSYTNEGESCDLTQIQCATCIHLYTI